MRHRLMLMILLIVFPGCSDPVETPSVDANGSNETPSAPWFTVRRVPPVVEKRIGVEKAMRALHAAPYNDGYVLTGQTSDDEIFVAWVSHTLDTTAQWTSPDWHPDLVRQDVAFRSDGTTALLLWVASADSSNQTWQARIAVVDADGSEWHADVDDGMAFAISFAGTNDLVLLKSVIDPTSGGQTFALDRWDTYTGSGPTSNTLPADHYEFTAPMIPGPDGSLYVSNGWGVGVTRLSVDGTPLWSRLDDGTDNFSLVRDLRTAGDGSIWLAGIQTTSVESYEGVVVRVAADGTSTGVDSISPKTPEQCCPMFGIETRLVVPLPSGDAVAFYTAEGETSSTSRTIRYSPTLNRIWDVPGWPDLGGYCAGWFGTSDSVRCLGSRQCSDGSSFACLELWEFETSLIP